MLAEEHKTNVIYHTINFVKAITAAYGSEEGMKLYETVIDTLDPNLKGEVFKAMLMGDSYSGITIRNIHPLTDKIKAIKSVRQWTGCGLKEAKDIIDELASGNPVNIKVTYDNQMVARREFTSLGLIL